jgi:hypothetical protein
MKRALLLTLFISLLFSCSKKQSNNLVRSEEFEIPDSLFALKNISGINDKLVFDSTNKRKLIKLDSTFNRKIIYPILIDNHGFKKKYIDGFESSFFISKQKKIGNFQPIILSTYGVDNWCILLVVVNSHYTPISHIILRGNYGSAYEMINKDLEYVDEYFCTKIDSNSITTTKTISYMNLFKEVYKDSINYRSEILKNGLIKTQRIDSFRIFNK